jgi:8-oxo-dGTP pyrophosphatase MutT (NUDIX family)
MGVVWREADNSCLLPWREKVAAEGRRMRGRTVYPQRKLIRRTKPRGLRTPSSDLLRRPPSPARGEGLSRGISEDPLLEANYDPRQDGAVREGQKLVRPRHAATLIIVRRDAKKPRLLMGRRNKGHAFMPDKWVFPGGRIDRTDFTAPAASELSPETRQRLELTARHASPRLPRALAMAAVRETFEEVGLLLAKTAPPRPGAGPWREFLEAGALADLAALEFVARAITPPYRPRRFDARFFMAEASALLSLERRPDCGELDEIEWVDLKEALALDLPNITRFVVQEVGRRLEERGRPVPFMRFQRGRRSLGHL